MESYSEFLFQLSKAVRLLNDKCNTAECGKKYIVTDV